MITYKNKYGQGRGEKCGIEGEEVGMERIGIGGVHEDIHTCITTYQQMKVLFSTNVTIILGNTFIGLNIDASIFG